jgi:lysophospholipase L1-like esterase
MGYGSVVLTIFAVILGVGVFVTLARKTVQAARGDPTFWEGEIRRFERKDRHGMPLSGGIVFTGSSSIRFWKTLEEDMAPLPVVNRGFGGSQIHQVTYYADRIILSYEPRVVVLYAGENDIAGAKFGKKKRAEEVLEAFKQFCEVVRAELPGVLIYYVSIKPPKLRLKLWPEMRKANRLIGKFAETEQGVHYVDVATAMLDAEGEPRKDLFRWDGLHMNELGYVIWASILRPILEEAVLAGG